MESFEPLINLLVLLTVLSVAAERVTNFIKLRDPRIRSRNSNLDERQRELAISGRTVLVGVILAVLVKANFFEIIANLDSPWRTLGWLRMWEDHWSRSVASASFGTVIYAIAGCIITGIALGFGSKFWHDVLGAVYELRDMARRTRERTATAIVTSSNDETNSSREENNDAS